MPGRLPRRALKNARRTGLITNDAAERIGAVVKSRPHRYRRAVDARRRRAPPASGTNRCEAAEDFILTCVSEPEVRCRHREDRSRIVFILYDAPDARDAACFKRAGAPPHRLRPLRRPSNSTTFSTPLRAARELPSIYVGSPLIHEREADYPPFINGLDFAGPGALAAYLQEVLANDTLWRRYAARGPPPSATRASGRHWGGITLDRHVCDACLAFYG